MAFGAGFRSRAKPRIQRSHGCKAVELHSLILKRRTIRKFKQRKVARGLLGKMINAARLAPSAANLQILEYLVVDKKELVDKIFPHTKWAGYLEGEGAPKENERPPVFIVILINKHRTSNPDLRDVGASAQNILLSCLCFGLAGCWIGSIDKFALMKVLAIPYRYEIDSLIALGYPKQKSKILDSSFKVKYWQDAKANLIVPKRPLKDVIFYNAV